MLKFDTYVIAFTCVLQVCVTLAAADLLPEVIQSYQSVRTAIRLMIRVYIQNMYVNRDFMCYNLHVTNVVFLI